MSTQFSLRRLSKMVKAVDVLINEAREDINRSTSVSINVHDELDSIQTQVRDSGMEFGNATDRFGELLSLRTTLRLIIGAANQANGVNDLVTELQMVNTALALYQHLKNSHGHKEMLSNENLSRRVQAARDRPETARVEVGYGAFGGRGGDDDSLIMTTLSEDSLDWVKSSLGEAKFRSEAIVDQLERINTSIMIEISDHVVDALTGFVVIQDPDPTPPVEKILKEMRDDANPLGSPEGRDATFKELTDSQRDELDQK